MTVNTFLLALIVFSIGLLMSTRVIAEINVAFYEAGGPHGKPLIPSEDRAKILHELWLRQLTPPLWEQACYSSEIHICLFAKKGDFQFISNVWQNLWIYLLAPITTCIMVWRFTRLPDLSLVEG